MQNDITPPEPEDGVPERKPDDLVAKAAELGLVEAKAFIQVKDPNARSAAAKRNQRLREKKERQGAKQLSVTLPKDQHDPVKALAARLGAGEPPALVWAELAREQAERLAPASPPPAAAELRSWRRWLAKLLGWIIQTR